MTRPRRSAALSRAAPPPTYAAYAGINGNTHGDRNDTTPATNAIGYDGVERAANTMLPGAREGLPRSSALASARRHRRRRARTGSRRPVGWASGTLPQRSPAAPRLAAVEVRPWPAHVSALVWAWPLPPQSAPARREPRR